MVAHRVSGEGKFSHFLGWRHLTILMMAYQVACDQGKQSQRMYSLSADGTDSGPCHFAEYLPTVPKTTTSSVIDISPTYIWESIDFS